jgi:UDP:flavonoid glycosyltransferase YjiC (YdhE family)
MRKLPELIEAFCHAGPPAIAITFGTEIRHRADLYKASVLACMERGFRAVVITQHAQQLPPMLPSGVIRCDFVPFQHLFPLCAAVIHHGGIGTVGTALAAGLPQVILPISFDQMDNAARVRRLRAGATVLARRARPESIESAVKRALEPEVRESCLEIQRRLAGEADPFLAAAQLIEELDAHRSSS